MNSSPDLHVLQTGGASLLRGCLLFSADSRYLISSCGNEIKVFSAASGECVHRLIGHEDRVTGVSQHPKLTLQIISSSLDSTIRIWDYDDGILMKTIRRDSPIHCIYSHPFSEYVYFAEYRDDQYCISRTKTKDIQSAGNTELMSSGNFEVVLDGVKKPLIKSVGFLSSGTHIAICKEKSLCIVNSNQLHIQTEHTDDGSGQITCIGCHPTDNHCVTGHTSGKIKFWHNLYPAKHASKKGSSNIATVTSTQHWHKDRVDDVCFTPGGSSVISVGKEGVLVQWHIIESGNRMDFFPRLGAPMRRVIVSNDGTLYATVHIDNSILILSNLFIIKHTIEGFTSSAHFLPSKKQGDKDLATFQYNMEYDWKTQTCVCNGKPGHLLFYQPYTDGQLYNLDITHRNYINTSLNDTVITRVAFSPGFQAISQTHTADSFESNTWMATVEALDENATLREHKLKIWVFDETKQWWKLNTVISEPHDSYVTRLVFRPISDVSSSYPTLLTAGLDGAAKLWMPVQNSGREGSIFWSCHAVATYRKYAACDADFSQDGSLAALAFEHTVCLCDPEVLEDVTVFLDLARKDRIIRILFGSHGCEHILIVLTAACMRACDLLSGSILWSVDVEASQIVCDPLSGAMAVFTTDRDLHVFRPNRALPLYSHIDACPHPVLGAAFLPYMSEVKGSWISDDCNVDWMTKSRLFFVTSEMTVHSVCTGEEKSNRMSTSNYTKVSSNDQCLFTPLAYVLSSNSSAETQKDAGDSISSLPHSAMRSALEQITDISSHVMPPVSTLCQTFLSSLLLKRSAPRLDDDSATMNTQYVPEDMEKDETIGRCDVDVPCASSINANSFLYLSEAFRRGKIIHERECFS